MKQVIKLLAVILITIFFISACNQYVCPTYAKKDKKIPIIFLHNNIFFVFLER